MFVLYRKFFIFDLNFILKKFVIRLIFHLSLFLFSSSAFDCLEVIVGQLLCLKVLLAAGFISLCLGSATLKADPKSASPIYLTTPATRRPPSPLAHLSRQPQAPTSPFSKHLTIEAHFSLARHLSTWPLLQFRHPSSRRLCTSPFQPPFGHYHCDLLLCFFLLLFGSAFCFTTFFSVSSLFFFRFFFALFLLLFSFCLLSGVRSREIIIIIIKIKRI